MPCMPMSLPVLLSEFQPGSRNLPLAAPGREYFYPSFIIHTERNLLHSNESMEQSVWFQSYMQKTSSVAETDIWAKFGLKMA